MRNSFLNQLARKVVEAYISRSATSLPVVPQLVPQPIPVAPPIAHPDLPVAPPIHDNPPTPPTSPMAQEQGGFIALTTTPRGSHVMEIDFKQAAELEGINLSSPPPEPNRGDSVDAIYNRLLTAFPLFPELPSREQSPHSESGSEVLEDVPISPVVSVPSTPRPLSPSNTFVIVD
jgi:hypothetical protein